MRRARVIQSGLLLLVGLAAVWYWQSLTVEDVAVGQSALSKVVNQCDLIATKAAADLPEGLPFQKLEKFARQSRVLERCMQDRGFEENPAWVKAAQKQATARAQAEAVSDGEAYETLRRQAMLKAEGVSPLYWRKRG